MQMKINPQQRPIAPPPSGFALGDIYYVLFRHKWRILICTAIGLIAAAAFYKLNPPPFMSSAKLFIRYVLTESRAPTPGGAGREKSPDQRGETIMESEVEILTSLDLARRVAEAVGPTRILAGIGGGDSIAAATLAVRGGMVVDVPRSSSVIHLSFRHPDLEIVQPVLTEVIERYLTLHKEIHREGGMVGDFLTQQTDQLRTRLAQTEAELRKATAKAGVISLDGAKKNLTDQLAKMQSSLFETQAELAERASVFEQLTKQAPGASAGAAESPGNPVPGAKMSAYRSAITRLEQLRGREQDLLNQFTEENARVVNVRAQLADAEAAKLKLEEEYPALLRSTVGLAGASRGSIDLPTEAARLTALDAKIKVLNAQMEYIKAQAASVDQVEGSILELQRKKEFEEANYRAYSASLEQSRINEALGAGKVSNISRIQNPSPPFVDQTKTKKTVGMIAFAGLALGLAWAFAIEMVFDHSVRRPIDVERMLGVPLFLSIPVLGKKGKLRQLKDASRDPVPQLENGASTSLVTTHSAAGAADAQSTRTENSMVLHSFHETLRDRLISYFESVGLTHKPKLVAVTGLGRGSGVTTTAAGLASSLSETGEGNVLLVDMTAGQGSAQQFYRGKQVVGLEEILSTRDDAQVQDKLYVVAEEPGQEKLTRSLPQRFAKLVPKLKVSNFDYIIFDMPPVNQISITPRLAGFMDMVLMVIESEKTDRELVQHATALLAKSNAHVGAVLNKSRNYVPARLHQEYLGNV